MLTIACDGDPDESGATDDAGATAAATVGASAGPDAGTTGGDLPGGDGNPSPNSDSDPSPPEDRQFVVARFDEGEESWSAVGPADDVPSAAALDPNGDVVLSLRPFDMLHDTRLVRVSQGEVVDEFALMPETDVRRLAIDAERHILAAGHFAGQTGYMAFDSDFEERWPLTITGGSADAGVGLALGPDLSVIYAGWSDEVEAPVVSRIDAEGDIVWETERPGMSNVPNGARITGIAVDPEGRAALALTTGGEDSIKSWIDAFAADGSPAWAVERDATGDGGITVVADGRFVASGYELVFQDGVQEHLWIGAYDAQGSSSWEVLSDLIAIGPIHVCGDGFIVTRHGGLRATVFSADGEPVETVEYEGAGFLYGTEAFCTADGGIVLVGVSTVPA